MNDQYLWGDLRDRAIDISGDAPNPELEQRIIDIFERRPVLVRDAIEHVAARHAQGKIRSFWAVLAHHVEQTAASDERAHIRADDSRDREQKIEKAERWIRHVGGHYDRDTELLDELFGDFGPLKPWTDDELLRRRLADQWRNQRTRVVEQEAKLEQECERRIKPSKPAPANPFL